MSSTNRPMMFESDLLKMYHAWLQGNERYSNDWRDFVKWAAMWNNATIEIMTEELCKYSWFNHE